MPEAVDDTSCRQDVVGAHEIVDQHIAIVPIHDERLPVAMITA
jgi:hypothetical protein